MTAPPTGDRDTWVAPDVASLRALRPPRARWVEPLVQPRRVLVTLVLLPVMLWAARTSLPPTLDLGPGWWAVLVVVALVAASTLATYVPASGAQARAGGSPCAAAAVVFVVLAFVTLGSAGSALVTAGPALLLAAMGLGQRLAGAAACSPGGR